MSTQKPPKGIISVDEAKQLNDNLTRQKQNPNSKLMQEDDNRSCWWSLDDLQQYIAYAKELCTDSGYTMNGLRIYLGAYGPEKDGETTMFIVPTSVKRESFVPEEGGSNNPQDPPNVPGVPPLNDGIGGMPPGNTYP